MEVKRAFSHTYIGRLYEIEDLFNNKTITANDAFFLRVLAAIEESDITLTYEDYKKVILCQKSNIINNNIV